MQTMKKVLIIISFVGAVAAGSAQNNQSPSSTLTSLKQDLLTLKELSHNFGKIPQGRPAIHVFEVINNGINLDHFKLDSVECKKDPIILSVGALKNRKGFEYVIKSMPQILKQIPEAHYIIVGSQKDYEHTVYLKKMVSYL